MEVVLRQALESFFLLWLFLFPSSCAPVVTTIVRLLLCIFFFNVFQRCCVFAEESSMMSFLTVTLLAIPMC